MSFGLCIPLSCGEDEVLEYWTLMDDYLLTNLEMVYKEGYCDYAQKKIVLKQFEFGTM